MLGRCRYKETGCHFFENKICNCDQIERINIDLLKSKIKISRDINFESELNTVKINYINRFKDVLNPYQLLFPRKWYKWAINGDEDEFIRSPLREADESLLEWAIRNVPEFKIPTDFKIEIWSPSELAINISKKFVSLHISGEGSITVPYISKVSGMYDIRKIDTPHEIALGQMAVICAFTGIPKGVLFVLYPSLGRRIYSYVINYSDLEYIKNAIISQNKPIPKNNSICFQVFWWGITKYKITVIAGIINKKTSTIFVVNVLVFRVLNLILAYGLFYFFL